MKDLLMLCPSRGRPTRVAELLETWKLTTNPDYLGSDLHPTSLLVALDNDDPELRAYLELLDPDGPYGWAAVHVGSRSEQRIGGILNLLAPRLAAQSFAIGFCGDDHRFRTPGWDEVFVKNLRELGTGLVYGDDLFQREQLPTAVAMTSDIVRTLGYMVPPGLIHLYFDNAWKVWGECLGRIRYLPDVIIEHVHPVANKAPMDTGYEEVNSPSMYAHDHAVFERYLTVGALKSDLEKLEPLL